MQKYTLLLLFVFFTLGLSAQQVVLSEISYNPPESGDDSLEFVELYNPTMQDININNWSFESGFVYDSLVGAIPAQGFIILAKNRSALEQTLGVAVAGEWTSGSLSNGGERIALADAAGNIVFDVTYDDRDGWPSSAEGTDGSGATIELCDLTADPADGANWQASTTSTGVTVGGVEFLGTPGVESNCDPTLGPQGELVVTEILYNDPTMDDDLEFFEIYNRGNAEVDLQGYSFSSGVEHTFNDVTIGAGEYLIMARNGALVASTFGVDATTWTDGALSNGGETIELRDPNGSLAMSFTYSDEDPWSDLADGTGPSLSICNPNQDVNDPSYWDVTPTVDALATMYDGILVYASPGTLVMCELTIGEVTINDSIGLSVYNDVDVIVSGVVHSPNFRNTGYEFTIQDEEGEGIVVFLFDQDLGYEPMMGDALKVEGMITHFNGLTEIIPTAIEVTGTEALQSPRLVTMLDNDTEGELVLLADVSLVDPSQWTPTGMGFDVEITDGTITHVMRVDADTDLFNAGLPSGTFDVTGLGWQFDPQRPYDAGFLILPRSVADISPFVTTVISYPAYDIATVTTVDGDGNLDSTDVKATLSGVVHGPNFRPSGLDFPLIDMTNDGIRAVNLTTNLGVDVAEGDLVEVKGTVSSFRGLAQILVDSITIISSDNDLVDPQDVVAPSEDVEGSFIMINEPLTWVDESQWMGNGGSFSIDATNGVDTFEIFIDNDSELSDMTIPASGQSFRVLGIGNQFDRDAPFVDNYQVMVRYAVDIMTVSSVGEVTSIDVRISPNPTDDVINIDTDGDLLQVTLRGADGRTLLTTTDRSLSIGDMPAGIYYLQVETDRGVSTQSVIKI